MARAEDRISALSDELIHQILSFLEVRQVAQTSILSKRWTNLWKSLRNLNIDDEPFFKETPCNTPYLELQQKDFRFDNCILGFIGFQYPRKIDTIRISCGYYVAMFEYPEFETKYLPNMKDTVSECVFAAVAGHAQEAFLEYIPLIPDGGSILLQRWSYSHLKSLHLTSVAIPPTSTTLGNGNLFLYYKFLETLTIKDCRLCGIQLLAIQSPSLINLTLDTLEGVESCDLKLIALPNLTNLHLKGYMFRNYITQHTLPSLITAHLDTKVSNTRINDDHTNLPICLTNLLTRLLTDAKFLTVNIDNGFGCASPHWDTKLFSSDTKLHNLKSLQFNHFQGSDNELRLLQLLVQNVAGLERLTIRAADTLPEDEEQTLKFMELGRKLHSTSEASSRLAIVFLFKSSKVQIGTSDSPLKPSMAENE